MKKVFILFTLIGISLQVQALPKLYLYIASNYMADETIADFKQRCNADLVQNYFGDPTEMEAKIIAGATGYDVIVGTGYVIQDLDHVGKLATINLASIKDSINNLDPKFMGLPFDPKNNYSIPYAYTVTMVGYNKDKLASLGIVPNSWNVIFDESILKKLNGKVSVFDSSRNVISAALLYLGKDPNSDKPEDLNQAFKLISKASKYWQKYDSTTYYRALLNGELLVAMSYSSDLYKTIQDGKASNSKIHLAGMLQKEGNMLEIDNIVLPKSSKNSKLAYCFIDTVLRPQNAAYLANDTGSTVPNRKGVPLVDPSVTKINWIYPPANAKVYSFTAYTPATRNMVNAKWIELKMNCGK